jgi:hypothetical protein
MRWWLDMYPEQWTLLGDNTIVLAGRHQRCDGLTNSAQALHLVAVASL